MRPRTDGVHRGRQRTIDVDYRDTNTEDKCLLMKSTDEHPVPITPEIEVCSKTDLAKNTDCDI